MRVQYLTVHVTNVERRKSERHSVLHALFRDGAVEAADNA